MINMNYLFENNKCLIVYDEDTVDWKLSSLRLKFIPLSVTFKKNVQTEKINNEGS